MENRLSRAGLRDLLRLARLHNIQVTYVDVAGRQQTANPETLLGLLAALNYPVQTSEEVKESLRQAQLDRWRQWLEPVSVIQGKKAKVFLHIPSRVQHKKFDIHLRTETGEVHEWSCRPDKLRRSSQVVLENETYLSVEIPLPKIAHGYHELEIRSQGQAFDTLVVHAPSQSYSDPSLTRCWGAFLPMYAAHSAESWGSGTFREWRELGTWIGSHGGHILGSLPILAAFLDENVCEPSPYSPVSRLFWNEFFLDARSIPEFQKCTAAQRLVASDAFQNQLQTFRDGKINYCQQMRTRRSVLEILAHQFFSKQIERSSEFQQFVTKHPHLESYARFRATAESRKEPWQQWPERLRKGNLRSGDYEESIHKYHLYVQWQAQKQMNHLLADLKSNGVKFYLDLPLGVHPSGYDVWREQNLFALNASVGAPPDGFFTKGQDWGFAPMHPQRLRAQRYRHLLEVLRFQMRHTGLLRIDHVMALRRLYWIPRGQPASNGAYVSYPAKELFALLCLESHRNKTVVVGENLGTVPPEVNDSMLRHHIRQMYVVQYEAKPQSKAALTPPTKRFVASLNTHDMPTFASFLKGSDISDRMKLGLIDKANLAGEKVNRGKLIEALKKFLKHKRWLSTNKPKAFELLEASLKFLSASEAEIVLFSLEDLWLEQQPQNTPGTSTERPNWVRKTHLPLNKIKQNPKFEKLLQEINQLRANPSR